MIGDSGMTACQVFVPRLMNPTQTNPQNNNARMMLQRWKLDSMKITTLTYGNPDPVIQGRSRIRVVRLLRRQAWTPHLFLSYFRFYDAIFYPGVHIKTDLAALSWRKRLGLKVPVICTQEGLAGDVEDEHFFSAAADHPVYCHRVAPDVRRQVRALLKQADHIIAISPFLARMGRLRYGDKFSVLPLGIDRATYYPAQNRSPNQRPVVVSAGRVAPHKRPDFFLTLAKRFPSARFYWYGDGEQRAALIAEAATMNLDNVVFPGPLPPAQLAEAFRQADVFVMLSYSEGVPKVTQEAAACGLPVILYGFYEAPSVVDGENGYVVWDDGALTDRLDALLSNAALRASMGSRGAEMAHNWDWDTLAPQWEQRLFDIISANRQVS